MNEHKKTKYQIIVDKDTHRTLALYKIDHRLRSANEVIKELLKKQEVTT